MARPLRLGPFVLLDTIGLGAMGTVYHAHHADSGARVAVKVVRSDAGADSLALSNLTAEIRAVAALDHPNIIRIHDLGLVTDEEAAAAPDRLIGGTPWFAMEVADEGSLKRRLRGLDGPELLEVLHQLTDALAHAHARDILHLDLKPANVLFSSRSAGPILSDFGMGVIGDPDPTGDFVRGTPHFMAPEQVRGRWEELGPWTDLYALGCLAWTAATGQPPMPDGDPHTILASQLDRDPGPFDPIRELPPGTEAWIRGLLAKDADRRPRSAADARRTLSALMGKPVPPAVPEDWRASEDEAGALPDEATGLGLALRREPPLVGRTRERNAMWAALRLAAKDARPQVVVVRGPRGSGKSRLGRWLGVRAHELGSAVALRATTGVDDPLHSALRRAFPVDLRDWDAESGLCTRLVERGLRPDVASRGAAWLAHGSRSGPPPFELVCDVLRAAAFDRPVVAWIDDVQSTPQALGFARQLLQNRPRLAMVLVLTVDDELANDAVLATAQAMGSVPGGVVIELGPLSEQARHHLARRMLPLDPGLAFEVAERAGGSPAFTVELLQDLANRKVLAPSRRGLTLPPGVELVAPTAQLQASHDQIDPLLQEHPDWERPLRIAACLGPRVDEAQWRRVCALVGSPPLTGLAVALVEARVWRRDGNRWSFLQPAAVESLAGGLADREIHQRCAEVLEASDPVQSGVEWERAGHPSRALDVWLRAASAASGAELLPVLGRIRGVAQEVLGTSEGASDPRILRVAALASECALALGWLREARDAAERMFGAAQTEVDRQQARMLLTAVAVEDQDPRRLEPLLHDLAAGPFDGGGRWRAPWRVAWAWRHQGDVASGRRFLEGGGDDPEHVLESLRYHFLDGVSTESLLPRVREIGAAPSREVRAAAALFEGVLAWVANQPDAAAGAFRAARRRYRSLGFETDERVARAFQLLAFGVADSDEALRLLEQERHRTGTARSVVVLDVVETLLRLPRVRDLHFNAACTAVERHVARTSMLDAELGALMMAAARRGHREDRTEALIAAVSRRSVTPA